MSYYRLAADAVLLLHLAFIGFVVLGGLIAFRRTAIIYLHLPAVIWGALIEFEGWICPLTPLEQFLLRAAGEEGYAGGFIERYLLPVIYPSGLTPAIQAVLGTLVVAVNVAVYGVLWYWKFRRGARG